MDNNHQNNATAPFEDDNIHEDFKRRITAITVVLGLMVVIVGAIYMIMNKIRSIKRRSRQTENGERTTKVIRHGVFQITGIVKMNRKGEITAYA